MYLLIIIADCGGIPVACSFCIKDNERLYGRHWGTLEYVPGLHFETCYQQGIEYAIANGLKIFEGGAQGEHKLARGFLPRPTVSFHRIAHPEFETAIKSFVEYEAKGIGVYRNELEERAPFKDHGFLQINART